MLKINSTCFDRRFSNKRVKYYFPKLESNITFQVIAHYRFFDMSDIYLKMYDDSVNFGFFYEEPNIEYYLNF